MNVYVSQRSFSFPLPKRLFSKWCLGKKFLWSIFSILCQYVATCYVKCINELWVHERHYFSAWCHPLFQEFIPYRTVLFCGVYVNTSFIGLCIWFVLWKLLFVVPLTVIIEDLLQVDHSCGGIAGICYQLCSTLDLKWWSTFSSHLFILINHNISCMRFD